MGQLLSICFGDEYLGSNEEREPLLTQAYVDRQISESKINLISMVENRMREVNTSLNNLNSKASELKSSIDYFEIIVDNSKNELK